MLYKSVLSFNQCRGCSVRSVAKFMPFGEVLNVVFYLFLYKIIIA